MRSFYQRSVPVKPTRRTSRPAGRFGAGISRYVPLSAAAPYAQSDLDWLNQNPAGTDDLEQRAGEALALIRLESGLCF